jgi:TRAP-type C4-dicarboxylate transport system substrate-binding protein
VVTGASAIGDFKLDEVANSYTFGAPLGHISFYVVMNEAKYNGLPEAEKAALDSIAGRPLSKDAEDGWNARAQQVTEQISSTGDNTVYTLTADEAAAFAALTLPVTQQIVDELGAQDVLDAMQGK